MQDLRYALRSLRRSPLFALTVAATLALGLGAVTATFSAVHALLLKPLPHPEAERLVALYETRTDRGRTSVSLLNLLDWRQQTDSFESLAGYRFRTFALQTGDEESTVIRTAMATSELFAVLGVEPALGRSWDTGDDDDVIVLSDGLWRRRFGASAGIVGQRALLNEVPHTVLGVLPAGFVLPSVGAPPDAFIPLDRGVYGERREIRALDAIARLAGGVSPDAARQELATVASRLAVSYPAANADRSADLEDLHEALYGDNRRPLGLLLAAGLLFAAIACLNVAHLMIARFLARRRRAAVRVALGARLVQLGRLFLVESAVLSFAGLVLGLVVARISLDFLPRMLTLLGGVPEVAGARLEVDASVLAFALALGVATTLLFGLFPALLARRTDLQLLLKDAHPPAGWRPRVRNALLVAQVAISMVLLCAAGLMLRSFLAVLAADPGFDSSGVLSFGLGLPEKRYDERAIVDFHRRLLDELGAIDGVESTGAGARMPAGPRLFTTRFEIEGQAPPEEPWRAAINVVSPGFFTALRVPLVEGNNFSLIWDGPDAPRVVLVNQAFRRAFFGDGETVGRRLLLSWRSELHPADSPWEVVGVVGDTRLRSLEQAAEPAIYLPLGQFPSEGATYLLRTRRGDPQLHAAVRTAVASIDPELVAPTLSPFVELVRRGLANRRLALTLTGVFAGLGVLLTAVGIYGLTALAVLRRRREMAIRMALGARRSQVSGLVLRQGLKLTALGIVLGTVAFAYVGRLIESWLYETSPMEPSTLLAVALLICGVTLAACASPSRWLARVAPGELLRSE